MQQEHMADPDGQDEPKSAYERAAEGEVDPRCIPQSLDGPPPVGSEIVAPEYPPLDHENWRFLFKRQMELLPGRAGDAFLDGVGILGMTPDRIPKLADLSARMEEATGWRAQYAQMFPKPMRITLRPEWASRLSARSTRMA